MGIPVPPRRETRKRVCAILEASKGASVEFGVSRKKYEDLKRQVDQLRERVERNTDRIDEHDVRLRELEGIHSALDEISGYRDMNRDDLLRVRGVLEVHGETLESLIKWAETEDYRERVKSLRYRFRHHQTRNRNALAALDD